MYRALRVAAISLGLLLCVKAGATEPWMSAAELRSTFAGVSIRGHYASGLAFHETYLASGGLDYREANGRALTGHWSIVGTTWCTIYTVQPSGGCFKVQRVSENCYEFHFQTSTEAEAAMPETNAPSWTARAWIIDRPPTCRDIPAV